MSRTMIFSTERQTMIATEIVYHCVFPFFDISKKIKVVAAIFRRFRVVHNHLRTVLCYMEDEGK